MDSVNVSEFDGIIIGGGHNGLVCANYLASAGQRVLVLEAASAIGGGLRTVEGPVAGFWHNTHAVSVQGSSIFKVWQDLDLDRHGARWLTNAVLFAHPFPDGRCLVVHKDLAETLGSIARFSERDAATFERLHGQVEELVRSILAHERLAVPLPADEEHALLARSRAGRLLLEFQQRSMLDLILEHFEHPQVRAALGFLLVVRGHLPVMDQPGTGDVLPVMLHAAVKNGIIEGGSARLAEALARRLYAHGGVVVKNHPVERIVVEGGRAVGVVARGRTFRARGFVASNLPAPRTLLDLAGGEHLTPTIVEKLRAYKHKSEALFGVHAAHRASPAFTAAAFDPRVHQALTLAVGYDTLDDLLSDMRDIRAGVLPARPKFTQHTPTWIDPSQAPAGGHATILWQFAPWDLADGGYAAWDQVAEPNARALLDVWAEYAPNVTGDDLLGYFTYTARDTEHEVPSMVYGDRHHGELSPAQLRGNRPIPELGDYRTPIERLYLCGSSSHPGGSITGAPGHNAAGQIATDLGLDRWWRPPDLRAILSALP